MIAVILGEVAADWKPASHPMGRPIFDAPEGETCNVGTFMALPVSQSISKGRA